MCEKRRLAKILERGVFSRWHCFIHILGQQSGVKRYLRERCEEVRGLKRSGEVWRGEVGRGEVWTGVDMCIDSLESSDI